MDDGVNDSSEIENIANEKNVEKKNLEEYIEKNDLEDIKKIFDRGAGRFGLKKIEFKSRILNRLKMDITDDEFDLLFTKLDFYKTEHVNWDNFISYLMLELDTKMTDGMKSINIEPPIVDDPIIIKSHHRSSIIHFGFTPSVRNDGTIDYDDGKYISMTKDGFLNFWTMDLKLLRCSRDRSLTNTLRNTWVTNFECLPDFNILVTSSTERELRFYDTTSKRFNLILVLVVMPYGVNNMHYHFTENKKDESILICGDLGGNVRVFQFPKEDRGPFKQSIGVDVVVLKYEQVVRGKLKRMKAFNVLNIHTDWVKEVNYYKLLGSFVSCSSSPNAMYIGDHHGFRNSYTFVLKRGMPLSHIRLSFNSFTRYNRPGIGAIKYFTGHKLILFLGIETFCLNEDSPMIVTGSLDCALRLWNPFITAKPISVFRGHHANIVKIFLQDKGRIIFSLDKDKVLKVWESSSQSCLQTYSGFSADICRSKEFCAFYNSQNHLLIVGGCNIATVMCGKLNDELRSDGKTHSWKVCAVFYNRLFNCLITCGMDSNIVTWDLWRNKAVKCIRMAHSYYSMGVNTPLPITAATLDPPQQLLLTGSRDGSIKMWDFNTGLCLRNMSVGKGLEVTKLIWLKNRILAVGWCNRVVEFSDSLTAKVTLGKDWELRHTDDILAADYRPGQAIATSTYNGDLIFWKLETGQSYKRYNVTYPTALFKLEFMRTKDERKGDTESVTSRGSRASSRTKRDKLKQSVVATESSSRRSIVHRNSKQISRNFTGEKMQPHTQRKLSVHCLLFLRSREMLPDQATLLTATENGMVQAWSHHPSGSFLNAFKAIHSENDYVTSMITDADNEYLFTGTLYGYIKIWLIKNYCLTSGADVKVSLPLYRLQFPFLIHDRIWLRAKLAVRYQPLPKLLSSYRGHLSAVMHLEYIPESKLILSGSADSTVRVWTLSGRYVGTLGQNKPWPNLVFGIDPETINPRSAFRVPPDVQRKASHTTIKVLTGAPPLATKKYDTVVDLSITETEKKLGVYGKPVEAPYIGHYHEFPPKLYSPKKLPPIDDTMLNIPVFIHLKMSHWEPIEKLETPPGIRDTTQKDDKPESVSESQAVD